MPRRWTRADAVAAVLAGLFAGVTVVPLAAAAIDHARELANRSACAANARGITQSMVVYANENDDLFPYLPAASNTTYDPSTKGELSKGKTTDDALSEMYAGNTFDNNPCASLWILVLRGQVSPKGFMCRSDPFAGNPSPQQQGGQWHQNFDSPRSLSYSVAYMWGPKDAKGVIQPLTVWKNTSDSSLAVISDVAPYLSAKAGKDEAMTQPAPGAPVATTSPTDPLVLGGGGASNDTLRNSPNHLFDGQNIGFADGHAEFARRPDIGQNNDNIWTQSSQNAPAAKEAYPDAGQLPFGAIDAHNGRMGVPIDVVMIPARSAKGDLK